jgi:hypothetical protein
MVYRSLPNPQAQTLLISQSPRDTLHGPEFKGTRRPSDVFILTNVVQNPRTWAVLLPGIARVSD